MRLVSALLKEAIPSVGNDATLEEARAVGPLLTHLHALMAASPTAEMPTGLMSAGLFDKAAEAHGRRGEYAEQLKLRQASLREEQAAKGDEHPETLSSMNNLAIALNEAGQHTEVIEMCRTVLSVRRRESGEEHPDTLKSMNRRGLAFSMQRQ